MSKKVTKLKSGKRFTVRKITPIGKEAEDSIRRLGLHNQAAYARDTRGLVNAGKRKVKLKSGKRKKK